MDYLSLFIVFGFGLIVGSFLNVVIFRFNTGMSMASGRSRCFSCGKELEWYELVPLFSFIAQRGACRRCGTKISWQYPLVELAGGLAFIAAYVLTPGAIASLAGFAAFILTTALLCLYIVITVYDVRHKIIPDALSYAAALVALALIGLSWATAGHIDFARIAAGPLLFLFFWFFWKVSKGRWMGLGDGKLALSVGWALGLSRGIAALFMSFWIGAIAAVAVMVAQRLFAAKGSAARLGLRSEIPFGPFIVVGFLIAFIWGLDIQAILSHLAV